MSGLFSLITPISYWILIILWSFILFFYVNKIWGSKKSPLFFTLTLILAIDAFRTLFESVYFGLWYTSLTGFIPNQIGVILMRPELVIIPKVFNVIAAIVVIVLLIKRWLPGEEQEIRRLETVVQERTKKLEEANQNLIKKDQQLTNSQAVAKLGSWNLNLVTGEIDWSVQTYKLFAKDPKQFTPTFDEFSRWVHPDDLKTLQSGYDQSLKNPNIPHNIQIRVTHDSGVERMMEIFGKVVQDDNGNLANFFGTIQDITELYQAQSALFENERKFRNLLESTSTVPWELDLESGNFTYMGKQIEKMLGYPCESWLCFETWKNRVHNEDQDYAVDFCQIETKKGNDHDFIYRALHADGSYRWIRDIVSVIKGDHEPIKLVGFMHDITEQKISSLENEKLAEQLKQSRKLEAIGTLAGGIAHDFNNILSVILGYTDMAKREVPINSQLKNDLDRVLEAGHRAKNLVKQILTFSRQSSTEHIPLKPQSIIAEALKMVRSSIPTTIDIEENIIADCGIIDVDPTKLHQVVINLCTNAFHAMEVKGGTLRVELKTAMTLPVELAKDTERFHGNFIELSISDTGHGIGPDIIEQIFDPFFTTKGEGKGTGMGLAISYGIVKEYGGAIIVESELDAGTTFRVYLPKSNKDTIAAEPEEMFSPRGRGRILLVDDEEFLAVMGTIMLERLGYDVTSKVRSLEALEAFQNEPDKFDLIITDQTMPAMTGIELSRRVLLIRPDIPVILCTGYSSQVDEKTAKAQGIKAFALKPIINSVMAKLIREVLGQNECTDVA